MNVETILLNLFMESGEQPKMELKQKLASLHAYLARRLGITQTPKVIFTKDQKNAEDPFGMTGYYDPASREIHIYITDRHDTDILRSYAHELIHHWQNERGTLTRQATGVGYAQTDGNLRKREMEAYLLGNILYRDFQDENRKAHPEP